MKTAFTNTEKLSDIKNFFIERTVYVFAFVYGNISLFVAEHIKIQEALNLASQIIVVLTQFFSLLLSIFSFIAILKKGTFEKFATKILDKFIRKK